MELNTNTGQAARAASISVLDQTTVIIARADGKYENKQFSIQLLNSYILQSTKYSYPLK